MCEHTVLKNGWDHIDPEIPKPKTADEILMEKCKRIRAKLDGDIKSEKALIERMNTREKLAEVSMWFTGNHCHECESPVYTDGKVLWCKTGCKNNGMRDYMGIIKDTM